MFSLYLTTNLYLSLPLFQFEVYLNSSNVLSPVGLSKEANSFIMSSATLASSASLISSFNMLATSGLSAVEKQQWENNLVKEVFKF